jgi:hypothetical protein
MRDSHMAARRIIEFKIISIGAGSRLGAVVRGVQTRVDRLTTTFRFLRSRNQNTPVRMRPCEARRSRFHRADFIPPFSNDQKKSLSQIPAMPPGLLHKKKWKIT